MKDEYILGIVAITGLVSLEITALICGFDGQFFSLIVGAISAVAGYAFRPYIEGKIAPAPSEASAKVAAALKG